MIFAHDIFFLNNLINKLRTIVILTFINLLEGHINIYINIVHIKILYFKIFFKVDSMRILSFGTMCFSHSMV